MEIEQLLKSDQMESPCLEACSSSNSILQKKRQDSMEIVSGDEEGLSSMSFLSDESDTNSVVIKKENETTKEN